VVESYPGASACVLAAAAEYQMLGQLIPVTTGDPGTGNTSGFYGDRRDTTRDHGFRLNHDVNIIIGHQQTARRQSSQATGATGTAPSNHSHLSQAHIAVKTGENAFRVAGNNISATAASIKPKKEVSLKDIWEGTLENGSWTPKVLLNGDEAGFLGGDDPSRSVINAFWTRNC